MEKSAWKVSWPITVLLVCALLGCVAAIVFPVFAQSGGYGPKTQCLSNIKQMSTATAIYWADHDDHMPLENWIDGLYPYTKSHEMTDSPEVTEEKKRYGYALKIGVLGVNAAKEKEPEHTAMYFETDALGKSVVANLAARSGRHNGGSNVGYMDTHGKFKRLGEIR
ncbi:MAG: hypothetical protein ABL949_12065 [Fimbriimonadaceae bacterium]